MAGCFHPDRFTGHPEAGKPSEGWQAIRRLASHPKAGKPSEGWQAIRRLASLSSCSVTIYRHASGVWLIYSITNGVFEGIFDFFGLRVVRVVIVETGEIHSSQRICPNLCS